ncbi:nucleotidyltransferase family protein [Pseudoalteromonas xiamenensis]
MTDPVSVSLFILAGGFGSRFGGDKQIAELPHFRKTIMDLNMLDAYQAGIRRVVLIINDKVETAIREVILPRLPKDLDVVLVNQRIENVPKGFELKAQARVKPWGTGHALWCARSQIIGPSVLITADDYYGDDAFSQIVAHFAKKSAQCAMVAYPLEHTLSESGGVNRGICQVKDGLLELVVEHLDIEVYAGQLMGRTDAEARVLLDNSAPSSMTFWGLTPAIIPCLEAGFGEFMEKYDTDVKKEYYLPDCIQQAIVANHIEVAVYTATQPWFGMTYQQELERISEKIYESRQGRYSNCPASDIKE